MESAPTATPDRPVTCETTMFPISGRYSVTKLLPECEWREGRNGGHAPVPGYGWIRPATLRLSPLRRSTTPSPEAGTIPVRAAMFT
jgi:hypothetical protein